MPNANTIARAAGLPGSAQGASSTAEFYFNDNQTTAAHAIVAVPYDQVKRKEFIVRAKGRVIGATAGNFTVNLDAGNSTTIASNTTIGTSGAIACDTDGSVTLWKIQASLHIAETSSKLQGWYVGQVNNTIGPTVTVAAESVEDLVADGVLYFKVSGTFSASNAGNLAYCDQLEIDIL